MNINALWDNFFNKNETQGDVEFLQEIPLFDSLKKSEIIRLERNLHTRIYIKDEKIFSEGEPGAALYIIKDGKVDIYKNYQEDNQILLASIESGTFFGELALFDESARSATVVAAKDTTLLALSKPDLATFSQKDPEIGFKISMRLGEILSTRLRVANSQIEELKYNA